MLHFCQTPCCANYINFPTQKYCTLCSSKNEPINNANKTLGGIPRITRHWNARNDSSKIAAILTGKYDTEVSNVENEPTSINIEKSRKQLNLANYKCDCLCNSCQPLPSLAKKTEKLKKSLPIKNKKLKMKSSPSLRKSKQYDSSCSEYKSQRSSGKFTRPLVSEPEPFKCDLNCNRTIDPKLYKKNVIDHLDFTENRRKLERAYMSDSNIDFGKFKSDCKLPCRKESKSISDKSTNRKKQDLCNIKNLSDFRNCNYEETHAPKTISDSIKIPIHTCIYPYELNNRLFVEPSGCRCAEGESRCAICDLPLVTGLEDFIKKPGTGIQNFEWEYIKKREIVRKRMENFVPQEVTIKIPVYVQEPNHTIIPQSEKSCNSNRQYCLKISPVVKKIYPRDSLALRFQKGMV